MVPPISSPTQQRNHRKNTRTRTRPRHPLPRTITRRHRNRTLKLTRPIQRNTNKRTRRTQLRTHRTLHRNGNQSTTQRMDNHITTTPQNNTTPPKTPANNWGFFNPKNTKTLIHTKTMLPRFYTIWENLNHPHTTGAQASTIARLLALQQWGENPPEWNTCQHVLTYLVRSAMMSIPTTTDLRRPTP